MAFLTRLRPLAFWCESSGAVSRSIGQPLALDALEDLVGALLVVDPKGDAVVVTEVEFRQIPMQVLFLAVLINAARPSLENREEAFGAVHMHVAAHTFVH